MTDKELTELYKLRGALKGQMVITKIEVAVAAEMRSEAKSDGTVDRMTGKIQQGALALRRMQVIRRELSQIIKEAENVKVPTQVV